MKHHMGTYKTYDKDRGLLAFGPFNFLIWLCIKRKGIILSYYGNACLKKKTILLLMGRLGLIVA